MILLPILGSSSRNILSKSTGLYQPIWIILFVLLQPATNRITGVEIILPYAYEVHEFFIAVDVDHRGILMWLLHQ